MTAEQQIKAVEKNLEALEKDYADSGKTAKHIKDLIEDEKEFLAKLKASFDANKGKSK
jgi:predicted  nucleic acid-binding Zn-ribbon protein